MDKQREALSLAFPSYTRFVCLTDAKPLWTLTRASRWGPREPTVSLTGTPPPLPLGRGFPPAPGPCRLRRPAAPSLPRSRVPASRRPGSCDMTLKASKGDGGGSMRTALSDLYLEHLLQKRSRPEVSGRRACGAALCAPGAGPSPSLQATPPAARSLRPGPCAQGPGSPDRVRSGRGVVSGSGVGWRAREPARAGHRVRGVVVLARS
ncbi:uncharacterized protein LOC119522539 [Choloepus didactylus]|uniref:uncharacterized protein LOC119522539 n=1 Tax=Choloepus didactylus TaxID=27675 RepID=UPI0018A03EA2|nr:uncharacterized protein LOC119522539 [Choloepus didactylus]